MSAFTFTNKKTLFICPMNNVSYLILFLSVYIISDYLFLMILKIIYLNHLVVPLFNRYNLY